MLMVLIFIVLPLALLVLAWRMKPLIGRDEGPRDALGGGLAAGGMFGGHGLEADPVSQREDTEPVRFDLGHLPPAPSPRGGQGQETSDVKPRE